MNQIQSLIQENYQTFSPKLRKIADYVIKNPNIVINSSITELSALSECSETTIFRLCKALNLKGFQDLKITVAQDTIKEPVQNIHEEILENDSPSTLLNKIFTSHITGLQEALNVISENELNQAIDLLASASRIDFFGNGGSAAIAMDAYLRFMRTGIPCSYQPDTHFQLISLSVSNPKSAVLVAISHSGSNKALLEGVKIAKERGMKVLAITSYLRSPISQLADLTLYTPTNEIKVRSEATSSRLTQIALLDALYVAVSLRHQGDTLKNIRAMRKAISTQRI